MKGKEIPMFMKKIRLLVTRKEIIYLTIKNFKKRS